MPRQLVFQVREEAFHDGVIVAVAFLAHALDHAMCVKQIAVSGGKVELPAIGVMNQTGVRCSVPKRHRERFEGERQVDALLHAPADNAARVEIDHDGNVQPAFAGGDEGL